MSPRTDFTAGNHDHAVSPSWRQPVATVHLDPSRVINSFDPDQAIGSSIAKSWWIFSGMIPL